MNATLAADAKHYLSGGLSIIPIDHSTKQPRTDLLPLIADLTTGKKSRTWKPYQASQATVGDLERWLKANVQSVAVVGGRVSGGLEIIDFDDNSNAQPQPSCAEDFFYPWWDEVGPLVEQYKLPHWQTGGNGFAVAYRCPTVEGNQKLAWVPDSRESTGRAIAIETRGEGGYAVIPPSLHPSGKSYQMIKGDLGDIPVISAAVRDVLLQAARHLCLVPYTRQELVQTTRQKDQEQQRDWGDDDVIPTYNRNHKVRDVLRQHGYIDAQHGRMSRPGKTASVGVIVLDNENVSFHWSSNDPLHRTNGGGKPLPIDPFDVSVQFVYNGDCRAAYVAEKKAQGKWVEKPSRSITKPDAPTVYPNGNQLDGTQSTTVATTVEEPAPDVEETEEPHPLNVAVVSTLDLGWVDRYTSLMTTLTGAPREFNQLAGLVTAATAIQRRARLRMRFGDIYPNIYGCIIARSSVYHKSTAIQRPRGLLQRAMLEKLLFSEQMTSEGLLNHLSGQPSGLVLSDEIGRLFASHNTKYLVQLKPDLTALYDCYPCNRSLSGGQVKVERPYLNILGATTPIRFFESVTFTDWQDGFLARWLFVVPENEPDFDAMTGLFQVEHEKELCLLAAKLSEIDRQAETDFLLSEDALALWETWQRQAKKDAYYYGDDTTSAIVTRYAAYALKFAIILAATNDSWGHISKGTMQTAMDLAEGYKHCVYELLTTRQSYSINGAKLQKVFAAIKNLVAKGKVATSAEIQRFAHMKKGELTPCLDKLLDIGAIVEEAAGTNGRKYIPVVTDLPLKIWR